MDFATNHRHRGVVDRRPCRRIAAIRIPADSARRTIDRPRVGSIQLGDCRNADGPQPPSSSSNSQADYREKLEQELKELRESELWQAGKTVRSLRPENQKTPADNSNNVKVSQPVS